MGSGIRQQLSPMMLIVAGLAAAPLRLVVLGRLLSGGASVSAGNADAVRERLDEDDFHAWTRRQLALRGAAVAEEPSNSAELWRRAGDKRAASRSVGCE